MKKLFFTMLGVCAMLCATSCSDETIVSTVEGESMVEFTVELTDGSDASRAISDGLTVEELYCEVYSMAGTEPARLTDLDQYVKQMETTVNDKGQTVKTATIRMALVKGQAYNVLFWAQAPGAYDASDLRNITVAPATANTESKDAFTAVYKTDKVTGPIKETITLTRPFAQINFGTTIQDYEDALKAGIDFGAASKEIQGTLASKIVASHGATIYDALTETSKDDGQGLTFGWAEVDSMIINETLNVGGVEYKYLATAYMLVPGGKESNVSDVTMEIETGLNENITLTVPFAPVQRNYRTNVLGNLLTNTADFTVIVDPNYNPQDNNIGIDQTENVSTAAELQAAINAAVLGNNVITFDADITAESIIVPQNEGINIVINGAGHKFDGTFYLYGNARNNGTETLTFNEINFEHSEGSIDFISSNSTDSEKRYAHNVTVENCTFTGNDNGDVVAMRYRQCYNMSVANSTATGLHSLMWATGCSSIAVDNVDVNSKSGGVSVGTSENVVVKNSNITVANDYGYGLRADASGAYKMSVENCELTADAPVLLRKASGAYALTLSGNNTLTTTKTYQIIVTGSDFEEGKELTAPTGEYTLTGAEGFIVYPVIKTVETTEEFVEVMAMNPYLVNLAGDIDMNNVAWAQVGTSEAPFTGTINGNGHKISNLNITGDYYAGFIAYAGKDAVIKDLTLENVNVNSNKYAAGVVCEALEGVTLENVKVSGEIKGASYACGLVHEANNVVIKNCENNANVTAKVCGGIASWITNATVENVVNKGNVTSTTGGAAGISNRFSGTMKNAVNSGEITSAGNEPAAGVVAVQLGATTYEYCYNYGNVTSTADNANASAGGILGQTPSASATLKYCANYGNITAEQSYAAGIAYSLYNEQVKAYYCYNAGAVAGTDGAGAIAPKPEFGQSNIANYCLNAGEVSSSAGIVYQGSVKNVSCYYYNGDQLLNVADNSAVAMEDALNVLNGGDDKDFFTVENGKIVVK